MGSARRKGKKWEEKNNGSNQISDVAVSLQWMNFKTYIQVSLEAQVLTITTVPEQEQASLWGPDE